MEVVRRVRVIPVLSIEQKRLVKTVRFKQPKYVGDPLNAIRLFNDKDVDELVILDIDATKSHAEPNYSLISDMAGECFMPLAYGGGIRNPDQAKRIFDLGVEKIIIGNAFHYEASLVEKLASRYGAQSIVVCIDVDNSIISKWTSGFKSGRGIKKFSPDGLAKRAVEYGAGEIIIQAVHKDGCMSGYDLPLIKLVSSAVSVPVVSLGGAGSIDDFLQAVRAGASAVAASSIFIYNNGDKDSILINYPDQARLTSLLYEKV